MQQSREPVCCRDRAEKQGQLLQSLKGAERPLQRQHSAQKQIHQAQKGSDRKV